MSLYRLLYDLRPWAFRSPVFNRLDRLGFGFTPAEIQAFFQMQDFKIYPTVTSEEITPPTIDKKGFKVALDMKDFKPNEFVVKTVDNMVVVEDNFDTNKVESTLDSDGVLTITAPHPPSNERIVQVNQIDAKKKEDKE
ncbi:unnamed protein product [Hermetia illucens]|uniref:SHSP domain-containing protein n=1 Tax=Hermetia illucens TaxID=343691 RepID=A0A7R8UKU8_HERIL|nr:unnamed protein product [Hermetia illucens]